MGTRDHQPRGADGRFQTIHNFYRSGPVAERYSDLRTKEGKRLRAILDAITNDLGGQERLNGGPRLLLDTLQSKLIVVLHIGEYVDKQKRIINKDGELLPVFGKSYLAYLNSIRLTLAELYKGFDNRKPMQTLEEYISSQAGEKTDKK